MQSLEPQSRCADASWLQWFLTMWRQTQSQTQQQRQAEIQTESELHARSFYLFVVSYVSLLFSIDRVTGTMVAAVELPKEFVQDRNIAIRHARFTCLNDLFLAVLKKPERKGYAIQSHCFLFLFAIIGQFSIFLFNCVCVWKREEWGHSSASITQS